MLPPLVSIVIATHNMKHLIGETLNSCLTQDYDKIEVLVYDDVSTDDTEDYMHTWPAVRYVKGVKNLGVGGAFNKAIGLSTGEIVVLMCADDLFTNSSVISDIVNCFNVNPRIGHVSRWYYQFINSDRDRKPCRAWRGNDIIVLANNPSGLAFRREALKNNFCSNKMFVETSWLVRSVTKDFWGALTINYDTVAVRVHNSTSTTPGYWLKRRVSSPVMDWWSIGGNQIAQDYVSLIQIKNGFTLAAVWEEIGNFIKLRPMNLLNPSFWFFALVAVVTPRSLLRKIPHWYRWHIGRRITKCVTRSALPTRSL